MAGSDIEGGVRKVTGAAVGAVKTVVEKGAPIVGAITEGFEEGQQALIEELGLEKEFGASWDKRDTSNSRAKPPKMTLIGQIASAGQDGSNVTNVMDDALGHMRYTTNERSVVLHMPQDISETLESSWEDGVDQVDKILSKGRNITELADGNTELVADAAIRKASRVVEKMGVEDLGKSVMRRQGLAENQHSHQFFSGMSFKSHSFKHKLISFTRDDTLMNLAIINFFKRGMKPSFDSSTSRRFLRYPPRFHIRFMKYDDLNPFLPVIRPCVCTNVEVSYTGSGTWSSFRNGSPVDIDLTLQFNEVELPYD
jgi:hypothetical protein